VRLSIAETDCLAAPRAASSSSRAAIAQSRRCRGLCPSPACSRPDRPDCHLQRSFSFRFACGMGHENINHQTVTILHKGMPLVAQARFVACTFLEEPGLIVGRRGGSPLFRFSSLKSPLGFLPPPSGGLPEPSLAKTHHRDPGFNQRALNREILMQDQPLPLRQGADLAKKTRMMPSEKNRSQFSGKVVAAPTPSSIDSPTNQRYSRLYSICCPSCYSATPEADAHAAIAPQECQAPCVRVQLGKRAIHRTENTIY